MASCSSATPARGAPARGAHCRGRAQHPLVLGRPGDRLRQRRARARGLRPRLLRREAMSFVATTSGITGEGVRDLMVAAVEHRFGSVNRLPVEIEWLTDNGSCYLARETRRFAREVGLVPCTTPPGWRTTTRFTPTARWATVRPVSSSPDQPQRACPGIKGQQQTSAFREAISAYRRPQGQVAAEFERLR